ncbi:MAG TPA: hypothetical protein VFW68_10695 [Rhodocyclaceae bacterium]|nr:hypothetical protein [Rhodocyclaceae bacterium]
MIGQQQAQARFDLRNPSNQQSSGTAQIGAQQNQDATKPQGQTDTDRRDVAVVAVLGYN